MFKSLIKRLKNQKKIIAAEQSLPILENKNGTASAKKNTAYFSKMPSKANIEKENEQNTQPEQELSFPLAQEIPSEEPILSFFEPSEEKTEAELPDSKKRKIDSVDIIKKETKAFTQSVAKTSTKNKAELKQPLREVVTIDSDSENETNSFSLASLLKQSEREIKRKQEENLSRRKQLKKTSSQKNTIVNMIKKQETETEQKTPQTITSLRVLLTGSSDSSKKKRREKRKRQTDQTASTSNNSLSSKQRQSLLDSFLTPSNKDKTNPLL